MTVMIAQRELRNDSASVLRRAESGEMFTITVAGRPVAELGPLSRQVWVSGEKLEQVWAGAVPQGMEDDIAMLGGGFVNPFDGPEV